MKKKVKLARVWPDAEGVEHAAGEIIEADAELLRTLTEGDKPFGAVVEQPTRTEPEPQAPPVARPAVNQDDQFRNYAQKAIEDERERVTTITALSQKHGIDLAAFVAQGKSVHEARSHCLDIIAERQTATAPAGAVTVTRDGIEKIRAAMVTGLRAKAGCRVDAKERQESGCDEFMGMSLIELARECRRRNGLPVPMDNEQLITETLFGGPRIHSFDLTRVNETITSSTSDFPYILANVANKEMLAGAASVRVTWPAWAKKGSLRDFKANSRLKLSEAGDLEQVLEGAGYTHTKFSEQREQITLLTWGKAWNMTRQMMINDDLSAFTDVPRALGRRAAYKPEILAVIELLGNGNMADGVALFHATHSNYSASAGGAPTTVDTARVCIQTHWKLMQLQSAMQHGDLAAEVALSIAAELKTILCGPTAYMWLAAALASSQFAVGAEGTNPLKGLGLGVESSPLLENALITGYSTTATYGFADPMDSPVIEVGFLNGNETPYQEEVVNTGTAADGRVFKVRLDCVAGRVDWRGATKENGA